MDRIDVAIIGGGPAGLSAALQLGRARKRVVVFDGAPRRNQKAHHMNGFVSRDHIVPDDFRAAARIDLARYPNVAFHDVPVTRIDGAIDAFEVAAGDVLRARRVLLAVGVRDVMPPIEGFAALWGERIVTCPYCHGWEIQDQRFAVLADDMRVIEHAPIFTGWSSDVHLLTNGFTVPADVRAKLRMPIDERPIARLDADAEAMTIVFADGGTLVRDVLFTRPPQEPVALVQAMGLELDGPLVKVDGQQRTSIPGIYASGDSQTMMQSAILAAASGALAAVNLNRELTIGH